VTQLSDDCFANDGRLMPLTDALAELERRLAPVTAPERVPLAGAGGRALAEDLRARRAVPPHDNSAVDGYAVYFDDLCADGPTTLAIAGRVAAGHPLARPARRGVALRVFTGAALPRGAGDAGPDTVLMQEDCESDGETVTVPPGIGRGANRRAAGEDVREGAALFAAGRRLRPEDLGLLAATGLDSVSVYAPLRVALFSTGDELREPGEPLPDGAIYDANRPVLGALLAGLGCRVSDLGILRDRRAGLAGALRRAAGAHDVLLTSGGVSVGEEDHVRQAVETAGRIDLWRLAIKPGRPVAFGRLEDGGRAVPLIALPGNPAAVMVTFLRVARPVLLRLAGVAAAETRPRLYPVRAGFAHEKKAGRREFVRCRLEPGEGAPVAVKSGRQGAGILSTVAAADGLVELDEKMTYVEAGMTVDFLPFDEVR